LVFSDDSPILSFILAVLKKYSVIVISSDSVENALIGFSNIKYKLVIRDLFMLRMGGTEGITQIKKENSKVLIIAISAGIQRYAGRCCYVRSTKDWSKCSFGETAHNRKFNLGRRSVPSLS
jgi:two-component SAPR family response regulator|tara:strand:- start:3475 stop:3837 length:363 start_codon:yes stop_codon:yes gene_type:complete